MTATYTAHQPHSTRFNSTSAPSISFEAFDLSPSNQRNLGAPHPAGTVTPLALRPSSHECILVELDPVVEAIEFLQAQNGILTQKLAHHGTLLFRGLPIHNAEDFSKFAHAFGYKPHEIIGIVVNRPLLAPNVAPANEAPKEVLIGTHNESPQVPHAPEYVFFYCHQAPAKGGETPILSSLELFHRAQQQMPEFISDLADKGLLSRVTYKVDKQYAGGSTLRQAFGKHIDDRDDLATRKAKIEAQIARYGRGQHTEFEWTDDSLVSYYKNMQSNNGARKNVTSQVFGDGTPIPEKYLARLSEITDEIKVLHKWEKGDVLVYDNIIAQHGRQPWQGDQKDRIVMASLFDGANVPGPYGPQPWAGVVQALDD